jgi:tetratricopeptide (TPR) repeat protein
LISSDFPQAPQLTIAQALERAYAHWTAGQAQQAEHLCRLVLQAVPAEPNALHLLGIIAHTYGKLDMALELLQQACARSNVPAVFLSNFAEMSRQKGLLSQAEQAARRATQLEPQLIAAWNNLGIILQESGKLADSLECLEKVVALQPENADAHNNIANTYKRMGNFHQAESAYRRAIELRPLYADAHSNLAVLLSEQGMFDQASEAGRTAISLNPQLVDAYLNLAEIETSRARQDEALRWLDALQSFAPRHAGGLKARATILSRMGREEAALECAQLAIAAAPDSAEVLYTLGEVLQGMGRHQEALDAFERAAGLPGTVTEDALVARAMTFLECGDKEAAVAAFDRVQQQVPNGTKALAARSDTKTYTSDDPDIAAMENKLATTIKPGVKEQANLHFALGKAYLDTGNSERAFFHLHRGNAIRRASFSYDASATADWMARIGATFTPEVMTRVREAGVASELPVFIVGMPRSGTTLVEQILASHGSIHGAGELSTLRLAVEQSGAYPGNVTQLNPIALTQIGRSYLEQVSKLAPDAMRLVDKMPANFLYAGLIPLILPGARIIHCRRDPVDTCLSCYSKNFSGEQMFAYDLDELGQFHRAYQTLMNQLRAVLSPERFIEVDYEAVVDDLEGQARRLIDFVGLPWNDACLSFHQTRRVVRTASVAQVRQPIYKTSLGRWRKHAVHLAPLLAALGVDEQ